MVLIVFLSDVSGLFPLMCGEAVLFRMSLDQICGCAAEAEAEPPKVR
jgi:hypothetical protein